MMMTGWCFRVLALCLVWPMAASPAIAGEAGAASAAGTIEQTICPLVENAARANHLGVGLLTRLIWIESRFQAHAVSPKGAQGIAQFMPDTAARRGLADPFDAEQAVPEAARLLAELIGRFGNIGLAAAAYNAGPNRVADWLAGSGSLPTETQGYVLSLTGQTADTWAHGRHPTEAAGALDDGRSCVAVTASLRAEGGNTVEGPVAPWGVQLAGSFSKAAAVAAFMRAGQRYRAVVGDVRPMILGGVLRSRGWRPFYRVFVPEASRADADRTCRAIVRIGGACVPVRT